MICVLLQNLPEHFKQVLFLGYMGCVCMQLLHGAVSIEKGNPRARGENSLRRSQVFVHMEGEMFAAVSQIHNWRICVRV